jgi:type IV pilus assembly protein PilQ
MVAFTGCALQQHARKASPPKEEVQQGAKQKQIFLEMVSVVGTGDAVLIEANAPVKYTAFKLSDPPRLIVDFPGVDVSKIKNPMEVYNNDITVITKSSYGEGDKQIGRIEIGLRGGVNHEVKSGDDSVLVSLKREVYIPGESASEEELVIEETEVEKVVMVEEEVVLEEVLEVGEEGAWEEQVREEVAEEVEIEETRAPEEEEVFFEVLVPAEEVFKEATMLLSVDTSLEGDNTLIKIVADGAIGNYNSFGLDDPTRFVMDIWGVGSTISQNNISIGGPYIERVRIGKHPDKVRVVFDSTMAELPPWY